jgi:hypothetical protein
MAKSIPVELGGKVRYLRFSSKSAQRATNELQAHMQVGLVQHKLQIDGAARLIEEQNDRDGIVIFLRHGLEEKISEEKLWSWMDAHLEAHDSLHGIAKALVDALIEARCVREVSPDRSEEERPRPTLAMASPPRGD